MQSSLITRHTVEIGMSVTEAKAVNKLMQRIWATKPGAGGSTSLGGLGITDEEFKLLESLYQHTVVATTLEG